MRLDKPLSTPNVTTAQCEPHTPWPGILPQYAQKYKDSTKSGHTHAESTYIDSQQGHLIRTDMAWHKTESSFDNLVWPTLVCRLLWAAKSTKTKEAKVCKLCTEFNYEFFIFASNGKPMGATVGHRGVKSTARQHKLTVPSRHWHTLRSHRSAHWLLDPGTDMVD